MNRLSTFLFAVACGSAVSPEAAVAANILMYGNSFTNNSNVPYLLGRVALAAGQAAPNIENAAVNGQTLYYHRTTAAQTALISNPVDFAESAGFQWDYVVFQEYSTKPTSISKGSSGLGNVSGFRTDSQLLFGLVKSHSSNVTPVMYQTWARHPNNASFYQGSYSYSGASSYPEGAAFMQAELRSNYALAQGDLDALVAPGIDALLAPVGSAFEAGGWDSYYGGDLYHQSAKGALLSAMVLYETIYQDTLLDVSYATMNSYLTLSSYGVSNASAWSAMTDLSASVVPEPSSLVVMLGGLGLLLRRRSRTVTGF